MVVGLSPLLKWSQIVFTKGVNQIFSPQWLISCDVNDGGCYSGSFETGLTFVEDVGLGK